MMSVGFRAIPTPRPVQFGMPATYRSDTLALHKAGYTQVGVSAEYHVPDVPDEPDVFVWGDDAGSYGGAFMADSSAAGAKARQQAEMNHTRLEAGQPLLDWEGKEYPPSDATKG